ncbi:MAG: TRAP transporter large permease subunit, partial [Clostridia bacterium]|nr:TRAP transporter large permease subunit [Clostridia bacterium]
QNISPIAPIICISVSSNLQGAATLVGDTTSVMLAGQLDMTFIDFFWYHNRPGMFFAVELGAALTVIILLIIFRKEKQPLTLQGKTEVNDYFPSILLLLVVAFLIGASFIPKPENPTALIFFNHRNGIICMGLLVVGVIYNACRTKSGEGAQKMIKDMDYETLLLLASLFIVVGCIEKAGVIKELAKGLAVLGNGNLLLMYTIIVFASVAVSAFVDNIPYVMAMLPVVAEVAASMGVDPTVLYFGLLVGATLGGNITPVGASANITGIGMLRKEGYEVKAKDFMKISVPFTLTAVLSGYAFIWLCYGQVW